MLYARIVNRISLLVAVFVFLLPAISADAQGLSDVTPQQFQLSKWTSFTSMVNARSVCSDTSGRLWVATGGGVFSVELQSNVYTELRNTEGLLSLDATCIAYHAKNNSVYIGTFDGYIEIYNLDSLSWTHITDIQVAGEQYPRRGINSMLFRGDTLILATDFGLSLFDSDHNVFIETIDRIGRMEEKLPVRRVVVYNDTIVVAGDGGVSTAPLRSPTLRQPGVWRQYTVQSSDSLKNAIDLVLDPAKQLYAMNAQGIYKLSADTFQLVHAAVSASLPFKSMCVFGDKVYYCTSDRVATLQDSVLAIQHPSSLNSIALTRINNQSVLTILYFSAGVGVMQSSVMKNYAPNTMYNNRVQRMCQDALGRLWIATSNRSTDGQGMTMFDGTRWTNFNRTLDASFPSDVLWRISATSDSSVWAATWGDGMIEALGPNKSDIKQYNASNSPLTGITGSTTYVLSGDAASDSKGNTWLLNFDPTNGAGPMLLKRSKDKTWSTYTNDAGTGRNSYILDIYANGTKWMAGSAGLLWYNETANGAKWGSITSTNSQLPDNEITALAVDNNGALWIGTASSGVAVLSFPSLVLRGSGTQPSITRLRLLRDQVINDIVVDALNNKWIATNTGVWVMMEDGSDTIGYINHKRYPALLSDEVRCLASDWSTGRVYIGSTQGLNAVQTLSILPRSDFSLRVYPQPFAIEKDKQMTIDGLEAGTALNIITLDGVLVRSIETTSRQAIWDGRDNNGRQVSGGVYLALCVSQAHTTTAVTKILVKP